MSLAAGCRVLSGSGRAGQSSEAPYPLTPAETRIADALAHYCCAFFAEADRNPERALNEFQRVTELDPGQTTLALQLAAICLMDQRFERAIPLLERLHRRDPGSIQAALLLGQAYQTTRRLREALAVYRSVIDQMPQRADGYIKTAVVLVELDQPRKAFAVLDKGLKQVPDPITILQVYEMLGRAFAAQRRIDLAVYCFEQIEHHQPDNLLIKDVLVSLYNVADLPEKALADLEIIARKQPDNHVAALRLGEAYEAAGNLEQAEVQYRAACAMVPPQPEPYLGLAALMIQRNPDAVEGILLEGLKKIPLNPSLNTFLGLLRIQGERFPEARAAFHNAEQGLSQVPENLKPRFLPTYYFWYAIALERTGDFNQAEALFEKHLSLNPHNDTALNYLAYMWADRGVNLSKAFDYVKRALELDPDNPAYLDTLGWIHYRRGEINEAYTAIRRAAKRMPNDPTIADHYGDILAGMKREKDAIRQWLRSLELKPDNVHVRTKLEARNVSIPTKSAPQKKSE